MTKSKKLQWLDVPFSRFNSWEAPFENDGLSYFALTDSLIETVSQEYKPIIHFWPTDPYIFLGMIDTKLPYFKDGLDVFKHKDYQYLVRNSGGLAVVSDPGILNFSLIFPEQGHRLTINQAYERMHDLVSESFSDFNIPIKAQEVPESYCPGDYDLSIHGKKIAGISQRRISKGIAIMIYLGVNGDQGARGQLIKDFYAQGLQGEKTSYTYPNIQPNIMTTLEEAFSTPLTVDYVIDRLVRTIKRFQSIPSIEKGVYTRSIMDRYNKGYQKMVKRNQKMLP